MPVKNIILDPSHKSWFVKKNSRDDSYGATGDTYQRIHDTYVSKNHPTHVTAA
jgi:hypothetical protein